uniref:Uncharacterized protein n=1 Tax=Siphoviridae sp. ctkcl3 TaxID=2826445 RepID=A0A8S5LZ86_9CAUD|nr:MAG TPA: hypothetical protein [Siphoviridae sp. ctkcl3]DAJ81758.1 MAG TPA: hypothetical protein [Bacteriophage sp.]DAM09102.1 MAG TPA: hypothetical protein [Caudoviricetes sp.]DAV94724.1 MAG TPA: hypothetical protein [Caudoviricetes sp.]
MLNSTNTSYPAIFQVFDMRQRNNCREIIGND